MMIVDASFHPVLDDDELRNWVGPPWSKARLPPLLGTRHQPPFDDFALPRVAAGDPARMAHKLFDELGVATAIVSPLTRGLLPNPQQAAAYARGTNAWVADRWLSHEDANGRFAGAIRLAVTDVNAALAELEKWSSDPRFVQIAVPLRTFVPYGDDVYFPIWRAATELDLPICVYDDRANVVEHPETPVGPLRYFAEKHAVGPLTGIVQISSLITSGVFDRLPGLRFVMGDGSVGLARPMFWRIDRDWRQGRVEIPWVERLPSEYLVDHIRFLTQPEDGFSDGQTFEPDLMAITDAQRLLLYGSNYPFWDSIDPRNALTEWSADARNDVLSQNAIDWFPRLRDLTPGAVPAGSHSAEGR